MTEWKSELNRLALEFWCGTASLDELPEWVNLASTAEGEVHPLMWELLRPNSYEAVKSVIIEIAREINGFEITSWDSEPYAQAVLARSIDLLFEEKMPVPDFCKLVKLLDANYNSNLAGVPHPNNSNLAEEWWLGDLWNRCDWCDDSWDHGNSPALLAEAKVVSKILANIYMTSRVKGK